VNHLESQETSKAYALIYFFCDNKATEATTCRGMLNALLYQLAIRDNEVLLYLFEESSKSRHAPTVAKLRKLLIDCIKLINYNKLYIIVDGLDEMEDEEMRKLLPYFHTLEATFIVRLFVASRDIPDIRKTFSSAKEIRAENRNAEDIMKYIQLKSQHTIETFDLAAEVELEMVTLLTNTLTERAKGTSLLSLGLRILTSINIRHVSLGPSGN